MESLILFLVVAALVFWAYKWLDLSEVGTMSPPEVLDPDSPRDWHESRCIENQNRFGRELNGYIWRSGDE